MTCDAKDGVNIQIWDGDKCEGDVQDKYAAKWGKCAKFGDDYYKITGASALQAAAVAVIAFAGSQFWDLWQANDAIICISYLSKH